LLDSLKSRFFNSPEWIISAGVFLVYWVVNRSYTGPAVPWDEIGYLANAALISGHTIDGATSYHAGYSFFLAPLFLIFSEPPQIWQAIMVLHAFLWSVSFLLLARILRKLLPQITKVQLVAALLVAAAYPAWITMAGYAYATTAFVFIYLLVILSLLFWNPARPWSIIPHCLLVGYLYWIHPIGLAVCIASFMVVTFVSIREKRYSPAILNLIIIVILVGVYQEVIDKWLISLATPEGYGPLSQHYPDSERFFSRFLNFDFWLHSVAKTAGHVSYLVVSSFGLILFGLINSMDKAYRFIQKIKRQHEKSHNLAEDAIFVFLVLSFLGVLAVSVIFFSGSESRVDHWIYGRYVELVILPLLALGVLSFWQKKWLYGAAFFVFLSGLLLSQLADMTAVNNLLNTSAFWPQYLIWENNFLYWMAAGSLALIIVCRAWKESKLANMLAVLFVIACFIASAVCSSLYHHHNITAQGTPSPFVHVIRESHPSGTCIGFNPEMVDSHYSFQSYPYHHMHFFHLYDYEYQRMSPEEWLNNCNGLYFTNSLDEFNERQDVTLLGQEALSQVYLLKKSAGQTIDILKKVDSVKDIYPASGWSVDRIIKYKDSELSEQVGPVGYYESGSIYAAGEEGFVVSGGHINLGPGEYSFKLFGKATVANGSYVEVDTGSNEAVHEEYEIMEDHESEASLISSGSFSLGEHTNILEIKVYIDSESCIRIDSYEIEFVSETND